jgi:hypothetical protein
VFYQSDQKKIMMKGGRLFMSTPGGVNLLPAIPEDAPSIITEETPSPPVAGETYNLVREGVAEMAPWAGSEPDTVKYMIKRYRDIQRAADNNLVFVPPPSPEEVLNQNAAISRKSHSRTNSNVFVHQKLHSKCHLPQQSKQHPLSEFEFEVHPDVLLAGTPYYPHQYDNNSRPISHA